MEEKIPEPKHPASSTILQLPSLQDGVLASELPKILKLSQAEVMDAMNELLTLRKVKCCKDSSDNLVFVLVKSDVSLEGLDAEERAVYEVIEESGNQGIWIRDIRNKTNLMMKPLNKILKNLETKKKIKAVKSVLAGKRKVYMLFDMKPDTKVTGDVFYSDQQEFDTEFTDTVLRTTLVYLEHKRSTAQKTSMDNGPLAFRDKCFASTVEILEHINNIQVFTVKIGEPELLKVLRSLQMAGKIESRMITNSMSMDLVEYFCYNPPMTDQPSIARIPCGTCPLQLQCSNTGMITPAKCIYLQEWMNMGLEQSTDP